MSFDKISSCLDDDNYFFKDYIKHCNPVQGRTGGVQQSPCFENRFPAKWTGSLYWEQVFPVNKTGFLCENVGTGNTCFYYRDGVYSEGKEEQLLQGFAPRILLLWQLAVR